MGVTAADRRLDAHERTANTVVARVLPYLGLALGTALTPFLIPSTVSYWLVTGPLVLLAAAWSYAFATRQPARAADPRTARIYVLGLLVLMALLVYRSPFYGFQAYAGFAHSIAFLHGRARWAGIVGTAVLAAWAQLGGAAVTPGIGTLAGLVVLTVVLTVLGGGLTYYGALSSQQSERRRRAIEELDEANRRLSESLQENARLHVELLGRAREAGVLDERARMAREIHDTIAQALTGIVTQLEAAAADGPAAGRHIDTAAALARDGLTEARRSVAALAPAPLTVARLPEAVADLAQRWAGTAGVDVTVATTGDPRPMLPDIEVTLFRVAQEALANVGKHARATRVGVTLSYLEDLVLLDVRDDGRGFVTAAVGRPSGGSGFGLAGMEQRVRRVSGTLAVESAPGEGTAVSASVPAIPAEPGERT